MAIFKLNTSSNPITDTSPEEENYKMAKYKNFSYDQTRLLPVSFNKQIQPGSFEYTLSYLIDNRVDL